MDNYTIKYRPVYFQKDPFNDELILIAVLFEIDGEVSVFENEFTTNMMAMVAEDKLNIRQVITVFNILDSLHQVTSIDFQLGSISPLAIAGYVDYIPEGAGNPYDWVYFNCFSPNLGYHKT